MSDMPGKETSCKACKSTTGGNADTNATVRVCADGSERTSTRDSEAQQVPFGGYDHFSKYIEAVPIPNKRMETVVETFVNRFVCRYGIIPCVNTDLGKEFESHLMNATLSQFGIIKSSSSVAHPASITVEWSEQIE